MPRGDRTGPAGMGPMTGRAAGFCAGYPAPGYANPYGGRWGGGFGWGGGRGWGYGFRTRASGVPWGGPYDWPSYGAGYPPDREKERLADQVKFHEDQIAALRNEIEELDKQAGTEETE